MFCKEKTTWKALNGSLIACVDQSYEMFLIGFLFLKDQQQIQEGDFPYCICFRLADHMKTILVKFLYYFKLFKSIPSLT